MTHPTLQQIEDYVLDPTAIDLEAHFGTCATCRAQLAREAHLEPTLHAVARAVVPKRSPWHRFAAVSAAMVVGALVVVAAARAVRPSEPTGSEVTIELPRPTIIIDTERPDHPTVAPLPKPPPSPSPNMLRAEEIENAAASSREPIARCFQAQRSSKLPAVERVRVTLEIGSDGSVKTVQLSDNLSPTQLGRCITGIVRKWKFRPSAGGTFAFMLVAS